MDPLQARPVQNNSPQLTRNAPDRPFFVTVWGKGSAVKSSYHELLQLSVLRVQMDLELCRGSRTHCSVCRQCKPYTMSRIWLCS